MLLESLEDQSEDPTVVNYVLNILQRLNDVKGVVGKAMQKAQDTSKAYYDRSTKQRSFEVNDEVMLLIPSKKNKLDVQTEGPVVVVQSVSETNYAMKLEGKSRAVKVYHTNLMKPYREREVIVNLTMNALEDIPPAISFLNDSKITADQLLKKRNRCP